MFRIRWAPPGLFTVRQLAERGLRPAGQDVAGWLVWNARPGRCGWAYLYRLDLARPKRVPSAAQRAAIARCNVVQQWCPTCRTDVGYRIPRRFGECVDCAETACERDRDRDENEHVNQHINDHAARPGGVGFEHVEMREIA